MANIHVVGRMETALAVGLYFTVKDYSNPGPHGGLVIEKAKPEKQHYAFVTAPNFLAGKMMLVSPTHILTTNSECQIVKVQVILHVALLKR